MTDEVSSDTNPTLHPTASALAEALTQDAGGKAEIVRGDDGSWIAIEEVASTITFVEARADELRIVPFIGDSDAMLARSFTREIRASWLDGESELVVDVSALSSYADRGQVIDLMHAAMDYWTRSAEAPSPQSASNPTPPVTEAVTAAAELADVDFSEPAAEVASEPPIQDAGPMMEAHLRADISDEWSWASSVAKIPQITDLTVSVTEPISSARVRVTLADSDDQFGSTTLDIGAVPAGTSALRPIHVPLSARAMSQVEERRGVECVIQLEDPTSGEVLGRYSEEADIQPRDLWFWKGDPHRAEQRQRLIQRFEELQARWNDDREGPDAAAIESELARLAHAVEDITPGSALSRCLLASFVRPNHPDVASLAREAASKLGAATGDSAFQAFQIPDPAAVEERVEDTVSAICEAIKDRQFAYSDPPPGWDYSTAGQRIRDHGDVARGGLATCMDSTVLTAAVLEHVGMYPVLAMVHGHIFVGYWRRDPSERPEWYPDRPVIGLPDQDDLRLDSDRKLLATLVEGRYLGFVESTALAVGNDVPSQGLKNMGVNNFWQHLESDNVILIDVLAARRASVSPLPTINNRADGITEIIEYRPGGGQPVVQTVDRDEVQVHDRHVDRHPARYRTWKASLFSLNATNDLLNLKSNAKVQPLVLPREGLGLLEDALNEDHAISLLSGYEIPEVWRARGTKNALQMLATQDSEDKRELLRHLADRKVFVQRIGRDGTAFAPVTFVKELRSMAHGAKTARDERGMNPLYLCLGLLRWPYKPGVFAEAPLILVPVNINVARGRQDLSLTLDATQQTTPNAALIEWLRREHGLSIPGLAEPLADRAGIDVDGVLNEVRRAISERGLPFDVAAEARIATLDLSAFRMWQDMNTNADHFFERPLVRHLVNTPTETFVDPAIEAAGAAAADEAMEDELEKLEAPIPADSTQKRAVLWARQGRTFVLQGPPGTGKSQTITNMVAECLISGLRVLFVAEKGTALSVVQRRLESIGLGPFTLNLHHEGSNAAEVRAQLKRSLTATVNPDSLAMESARRQLRNARFELTAYPQKLHKQNAAGLSAYGAHDELLVLQDGPTMPIPTTLVAHQAEQVEALKELFEDLQRWTSAAGVRQKHPWRLAGAGKGDPFDVDAVSVAVRGIFEGIEWSAARTGPLREALDSISHPRQLDTLAAASNPTFPSGDELAGVMDAGWPARAADTVAGCERAVAGWSAKFHGFSPEILSLDVREMKAQFDAATNSGFMGRKGRQTAALAALAAAAPTGLQVDPTTAGPILADLVAAKDAGEQVRASLLSTPGLGGVVPANPYMSGAFTAARARLDDLTAATASLRDAGEWTRRASDLAQAGQLAGSAHGLASYATAWRTLWDELLIQDPDFEAWREELSLADAVRRHEATWRKEADYERLVPLQRWCTLVRKLEPMRTAGLSAARIELLEGRLPAYTAEDALARGVAKASLAERIATEGLDRFDAVAHDQRVTSYSSAQEQMRRQWITDGPARMLARRGGGGLGSRTGGLARELEKTTRKLGTRPILRKYGEAVQELTPLVLCSPSSVVDLIEPGVMEFDLVIFDEASQVTVPEAIGALGRARGAVVVGDSKQMPPTRKVGGGPIDDEDIDEDAEEVVEDQESILSECELARVPTLSLSWHYRSQDEALIAFSNRAYYRGELSSFPTPTLMSSETGVEFRRVRTPDGDDKGMYLRAGSGKVELGAGVVAGSNTNPFEAVEIVNYVHELLHASGALPSVGIVTFNEQQRQLIEDMLNVSADAKIAEVMDPMKMGRGDVLFVKALEQVQGDERDIIVFSVAFSKQANGKIPTNFGPLTNSGGERRLNVAVTRARRKNVVFCSFEPAELDVASATYQGPKDLKEFLAFARAAGAVDEQDESGQRIAIRDRHRDDIAKALREAGLHVMSDVGLSNFRLDLVLARPDTPDRPLLPVLLDGESWKQRNTVSDRDVLPVEVLENLMGWPTVARIWWPMWLQNRDEVISKIVAEVDRAEARLQGKAAEGAAATASDRADIEPVAATQPEDQVVADAPVARLDNQDGVRGQSSETRAATGQEGNDLPSPTTLSSEIQPGPEPAVSADGASTISATPVTSGSHVAASEVDSISEFAPAHTNVVGTKDVLDALPDRAAATTVREQVLDVIEAEGPVETARLARIVARRFGLSAVRAARVDDITRLIPRNQVKKSRLGAFAWPEGLDASTWTGFRYVDPEGSRSLDEVAPEEIANAMKAVAGEYLGSTQEEVLRRTAELFGIVRLGANVRMRLDAVYKRLPAEPVSDASPSRSEMLERASEPAAPQAHLQAAPPEPTAGPVPMAEAAPVRTVDHALDRIAQEAASIQVDFNRVQDYVYYDYSRERELSAELKRAVHALVTDPDYDGQPGSPVAQAHTAHLAPGDAESVAYVAPMVWRETIGKALERTTSKLVSHLAADPDFEPLPWTEEIDNFVARRLEGKPRGLVVMVQRGLNQHAYESGLIAKVEEEIKRDAQGALAAMTPLDRDMYGFTTRNAKRLQLAEPYISHIKDSRKRFVIYWMSRIEGEESGLQREARYATAIRALISRGETRAAVSRRLGISTSVMDRIERENRRDVPLAADDPILTDLAPELRSS